MLHEKNKNKNIKNKNKLQVQWTLREKKKKSIWQIDQSQEIKNILIPKKIPIKSISGTELSFRQLFLPEKKKTWCGRGKKVTLFSQVLCASLWMGSSSAVGSEVSLHQGLSSWLLFDVITAGAVALLVRDALREGELVHLWSFFLYLQRGL